MRKSANASGVSGTDLDDFIRKSLTKIKKSGTAAVFLLKGGELRRLKKLYTGKAPKKEVDVLAFPETGNFPHPENKKRFFGDIYLNQEIAKQRPDRARYLAAHGLLHLLGYTHDGKNDTLKMEKKEQELLK